MNCINPSLMLAPGECDAKMNRVLGRALNIQEGFKRQVTVALGDMV